MSFIFNEMEREKNLCTKYSDMSRIKCPLTFKSWLHTINHANIHDSRSFFRMQINYREGFKARDIHPKE